MAEFSFQPDESLSREAADQLYQTSPNKYKEQITYGDCIAGMAQMDAESVDLVIADPPFGIGFSGKETVYNRNKKMVIGDYCEIDEGYDAFSKAWIGHLPRVMKPAASAYIFSGYTNLEFVLAGIRQAGLTLVNHCIWAYPFGVFTTQKFVSSHYHLLLVAKSPRYYFNRIRHYQADVWGDLPRDYKTREKKNGTKLPVGLVKRCIDYNSRPGDLVLDPFLGNGTTAVAAKANFRHYCGFEINDRMKKIIGYNLRNCETGSGYVPYADLLPTPEELGLRKGYQRAYKEYLKRKKEQAIEPGIAL